jgi:hypothetical protein
MRPDPDRWRRPIVERRHATLLIARLFPGSHRRRSRSAVADGADARLYESDGTRYEAHLGERSDGNLVVLLVSLGRRDTRRFLVDPGNPWRDFERKAGFTRAPWGVCRDPTAGL